jgi:hypothetical protein
MCKHRRDVTGEKFLKMNRTRIFKIRPWQSLLAVFLMAFLGQTLIAWSTDYLVYCAGH